MGNTEQTLQSEIKRLTQVQQEQEAQISAKAVHNGDLRYSPLANFTHLETLGLTKRRQEHLATLGLDLASRTVLEVGAGIGDHTGFFLDRGCKVLSTDGRKENLAVFRKRYFVEFSWYTNIGKLEIAELDIDHPPQTVPGRFDIVYCYGTLYHLEHPGEALDFLSRCCDSLLLLETSVSFGNDKHMRMADEDPSFVSQSIHGKGCHPSRPWVFSKLQELFEFAYMPTTQPCHEQFPLDWTQHVSTPRRAKRAVFIGSRTKLVNSMLLDYVPDKQTRLPSV
jgi:2-polyprenyl-3-methyl-5-hydroxy-6-metoxy-1,4-benzoquinol methylase